VSSPAEGGPARRILLLLDDAQAAAAVRVIEQTSRPGAVETLLPPRRGVDFFTATGEEGAELDAWWQEVAATVGRPVVLAMHEEELPAWVPGLDADFVVAVPDAETVTAYDALQNVRCCVDEDPRPLAELALREHGLLARGPDLGRRSPPDPFALLAQAAPVPLQDLDAPTADPVLEAPRNRRELLGPPGGSTEPSVPGRSRMRILLGRLSRGGEKRVSQQLWQALGQVVLAHKPVLVAVVSRKGGVGKTASAAAIAAILGEALDPFGHTAALVDANIGNPDAWGRLDIRGESPTVRDTVARLAAGRDPQSPAWSRTPALAVYPESREAGDGYTPAEVQRLATYLRLRHAAIVVDLPNRLPAFSSAEASVAASWIDEAEVVVMPTTADPTALLGVIEYMEVETVRKRAVVVPYIVPKLREIRHAPEVRQMIGRIRAGGGVIAEVPDDDRATLALIRHTAITEVGSELRRAYVALSAKVMEAAGSHEVSR
jgi:MinD-like ATPase involved in chromosome partitioning or flagellar assembly